MIIWRIACLIIGYFLGTFESGLFYGKKANIDLTKEGSGNTGATNTLRVMGKKAGAVVLLLDVLKCLIPALIVYFVSNHFYDGYGKLFLLYTAFGAILGHNFPFYLNFKGGKGIACTGALYLAFDARLALVGIIIFALIIFITGYVSLGSLIAVAVITALASAFTLLGFYHVDSGSEVEMVILLCLVAILAYVRHRANIVRLLNKTEHKFSRKK